jgi:hypothetical protein
MENKKNIGYDFKTGGKGPFINMDNLVVPPALFFFLLLTYKHMKNEKQYTKRGGYSSKSILFLVRPPPFYFFSFLKPINIKTIKKLKRWKI